MGDEVHATSERPSFLCRAVVLILVLGLAIRLILMPLFTYPYDIEHWAIIMQNSESGNGLFGLTGYFYTPVWGYLLNLDSFFANTFLSIGEYGSRCADLFGIEGFNNIFFTATTTSTAYDCLIKVPLIIVDVLVGYCIYRLVLSDTGDFRKAIIGFGLWFLCPVVIYMSSIQGTFDCICALMTLLSLVLLRKDRCFMAGAMFALAALTKFFPAFMILLFCAYVLKVHEDDGRGLRKLVEGILGACAIVVILLIPQILDGTVANNFTFVTDRTSEAKLDETIAKFLEIIAVLFVMIYTAIRVHRSTPEGTKSKLLFYALAVLAASVLMRIGPQYSITFLPILAYFVVTGEKHYGLAFIMIGFVAAIVGFMNNSFSIFTSLIENVGVWNVTSLLDVMGILDEPLLGTTVQAQIISALNIVQRVTIVLMLLFMWEADYKGGGFAKLRGFLVILKKKLTRCPDEAR